MVATRAVDRCGPGHVPTPLNPTGTEDGQAGERITRCTSWRCSGTILLPRRQAPGTMRWTLMRCLPPSADQAGSCPCAGAGSVAHRGADRRQCAGRPVSRRNLAAAQGTTSLERHGAGDRSAQDIQHSPSSSRCSRRRADGRQDWPTVGLVVGLSLMWSAPAGCHQYTELKCILMVLVVVGY